ncbi:hypothetical protein [Mucilaginibacter gotjawali]|uniref:Uncharacterized protein n=2 Tax=Mucilaginibacter gotjawali TaxID=1550579 RepID=A0A839SK43_9SPHI|nr:hypothetical protein [Mucilaginibacter gotjawali]MBB3056847.1 hypothetical protein [Mucilaginibacter gotjawali]BAU55926.1 hypothetical protein MgSA37_04118 [Mucilaginibacter gotjawali]
MKPLLISLFFAISVQTQPKQQKIILPPPDDYYLNSTEKLRYAFFKFDSKRDEYIFDKKSKPATLSKTELLTIEKLIVKGVGVYNKSRSGKYNMIKKPEKYFKQFIAITNTKGEKEVWVNCCCAVMHKSWKTHIQQTSDGGSCYFTIKINLTKNKATKLNAHGLA